MSAEKLLDAMQYLPDEMLEQTDRLRQRKTFRWKPLVATAACLCLLLGAAWGVMQAGMKTAEDGAAPESVGKGSEEDFAGLTGDTHASTTANWLPVTVHTVAEGRLTVTLPDETRAEVLLTQLENVPALEVGQKIRLYLENTAGRGGETLIPYKIEIEEDTK